MNKYIHAGLAEFIGLVKFGLLKVTRGSAVGCSVINLVSPRTEITVDRGGKLSVGKIFKMREDAILRVRKGAAVKIGKNFNMSNRCIITAYERVEIGDDVQFGPDVKVYDQDHDFRAPGGLKAQKFKTAPVKIGNNVWIGANCIILRGTEIGDNAVIGAGSVVKGTIPPSTTVVQKREQIFWGGYKLKLNFAPFMKGVRLVYA